MSEAGTIKYSIDTIKKEEGKIVVSGWAYDIIENEEVEFSIIGKASEGAFFMREQRTDVNQKHGINLNQKIGFKVFFDSFWKNKRVKLKAYNANGSKCIKINLGKTIDFEGNSLESKIHMVIKKSKLGVEYFAQNGVKGTCKRILVEIGFSLVDDYKYWIETEEKNVEKNDKEKMEMFEKWPKISILLPVYNTEEKWLRECIESVFAQSYPNWELCIADDNSTLNHIKRVLNEYRQKDSRIKIVFRQENGHISEASNTALECATGDYIALLDHDDTLAPFALYRIVEKINTNAKAEFIYSDEDKINRMGKRSKPFFKPDWSPDTLFSQNYICHLMVIKSNLIRAVGGFRVGFEGAQDYDLALRCTELTSEIYHIPEILYHWRMIKNSTADNPEAKLYAFEAGKKAVESALKRKQIAGMVNMGKNLGTYNLAYEIEGAPKVSIIIPTKDHEKDLRVCIDSIIEKTDYSNYEIIVIDNGSIDKKIFKLFEEYNNLLKDNFKVIRLDIPFNYSTLNNEGVKNSSGEFIVLMNNDIQIITNNWLQKMLSFAQQKHIGAVGAKLYFNDGTIQHAGVVVGVGGVAGHSHKYYSDKNSGYFSRLMIDSNYAAVTAACLMVEKKKYLEVDGLDSENLAVAFNDVDFCLKLLDKQYFNICLSQVECYHHESKSRGIEDTKEKRKRFEKEVVFMKEKWKGYIAEDPYYNRNLTLRREDFSIKKD